MDNKVTFKIGENMYSPVFCNYTDNEIFNKIVEKLGVFVKDVTEEQFYFTKKLLQDGWEICDCYYGEKNRESKCNPKLKTRLSWFKFNGINSDACLNKFSFTDNDIIEYVSDYVLYVNYDNTSIFLYDNTLDEPSLIGTFHCYDDIVRSLKHIRKTVPAKLKITFKDNKYTDNFDYKNSLIIQSDTFCDKCYEIDFNKLNKIDDIYK